MLASRLRKTIVVRESFDGLHVWETSSVCLVQLVCFVYLVDLVHLVSFVLQKTRQTEQTT